jgi:hypothetical protein
VHPLKTPLRQRTISSVSLIYLSVLFSFPWSSKAKTTAELVPHPGSDRSDSDIKVEKSNSHVKEHSALELDKRGLPLMPQPSDHKDDLLNRLVWQKYYIVVLMSAFTLMAQLGFAIFNPSFVLVAKNLHATVEQASCTTTVFNLSSGVFPLLIAPSQTRMAEDHYILSSRSLPLRALWVQ